MTVTYPAAVPARTPEPGRNDRPAPLGSALTEHERDILELLSRGHSNGAIGRQLYITENTVKTHLKALYRRLGAVDRAHAVRRGFELGLLTPDGEVTS